MDTCADEKTQPGSHCLQTTGPERRVPAPPETSPVRTALGVRYQEGDLKQNLQAAAKTLSLCSNPC